jgi:hypothetical protein
MLMVGTIRRSSVRVAVLTLGVGVGLLPTVLHFLVASHARVSSVVLGNIAMVSLVAAGVIIHRLRLPQKVARLTPWLACGALLGAGLIGPLRIGLYVLIAAASFGIVGAVRGVPGIRGALTHTVTILAAAVVNFAGLWPFTLGLHRPAAPAPYLSLDLRAHTLLADIPLHDVWVVHLSGGGTGRALVDVDEAMRGGVTGDVTVALAAAITTYMLAARVMGLAREECFDTLSSVRQRLTEADRERSLYRPGERGFVYYFERESLLEIQTCTARALYAFALEPEESGYVLYWGVYADRVSWVTPYYMRLIDPVRRLVVYPSILQRIEQRWRARWRAAHEPLNTSRPDDNKSAADARRERSW